jgi:ribosome recycling factor
MSTIHHDLIEGADVLKATKKNMTVAKEHLHYEFNSIRTGRANPALLDGIHAEVYGTTMRLKDVATVSAPEAQQLLVTPFDANNTNSIAKGLEKANLGLNLVVEPNLIRISIPPMDEHQRKEKVKNAKKKTEDGKVAIRNIRRECNDFIKKQKNSGNITEDELKKLEKDIQKLTDDHCLEFDEMFKNKEKDIMAI